jgi:hypothetical protein
MESGDPESACRAPRTGVAGKGKTVSETKRHNTPSHGLACIYLFDILFELMQRLGFDIKCPYLSSIGQPWTNQLRWEALVQLGAWFVQVVVKVALATETRKSQLVQLHTIILTKGNMVTHQ